VYQLVFVAFGAVALTVGFGYYGLLVASLLATAIFTRLCWRGVQRLGVRPHRLDARKWLPLVRASLPFGVISFAIGLSYKFDSILLNIFRGDAETGYYSAVYNLVFSVVLLSNVFNTALYPSLSRRVASASGGLTSIYQRALCYLLLTSLPIAVAALVLADRLVPLLFTQAYAPAIPALQVLMWTAPLMFASEFLGYLCLVQAGERHAARAVLASTGLNMGVNLVLVPWLGFMGAAVMTVVTEAVLVGQYVWLLRGLMRQIDWGHTLLRPLAAATVMGGLLVVGHDLPLLAVVAVGAVSYIGLLLFLGVIGGDEVRFLRSLRVAAAA
jgi:O-antigen/teichoic acid export membrane protein